MNELIKKIIWQILDYSHQSTNPTYFMEITLYFIFLKYIILQDENERKINIENFNLSEFFNDQISVEDAKKIAMISVGRFIKQNDIFFDNDSFKWWFQDIFTNWIFSDDYRPAFRNIAEAIYWIEDKKELVDIFESLLSQFWGRFQWEFNGSDDIHKIISGVLDMKKGTVYDPACGSGQLLVEIQKNARQKIEFFWKEINALPYGLAKINFYIHGLSGELQLGDTFASDINENIWRFDYTVCEPPLWMRLERGSLHPSVLEKFSVQSNNSDQLWLQYVIESLNITGKWVILLPMSSTFKKIHSSKRKELADDWIIDSIILLPKWILKPYAAVDVVLWIFDKWKRSKDIFFIDWRELPIDEIIEIQKFKPDIKNKSKRVVYEDIVKYDFNLNPWIQVNWIEKEIENYSEDKIRFESWWLKKITDEIIPPELLDGLPESVQFLIKKGKVEWKITSDELFYAMPNAEEDIDKLDDLYTRLGKLNIEIINSFTSEEIKEKEHEYEEVLPEKQKDIEVRERESNIDRTNNEHANNQNLKNKAFRIVGIFMAVEIVVTYWIFISVWLEWLKFSNEWALNIFTTATIWQITAIFYWIIKHLFPNKESKE